MDIQKEREAFEKYIQTVAHPHRSPKVMFFTVNDGHGNVIYCDISIQNQWETWQAAQAKAVPKWVSVEDRLPPCDFEFCETGEQVSNVVLIHSAATYGFNMGMGHVNEDGVWNAYSGEYDFMNVLMVTHWMPLPDAPQEPAND